MNPILLWRLINTKWNRSRGGSKIFEKGGPGGGPTLGPMLKNLQPVPKTAPPGSGHAFSMVFVIAS